MPSKKKEEKRKCSYEYETVFPHYKCSREALPGEQHCIFHSKDIEEKKDKFNDAFLKEFERQKEHEERYDFTGFVFPGDFSFRGQEFQKDTYFGDTQLSDEVDFRGVQFSGEALFIGAQFSGRANFIGAQFSGKANFMGAQFSGVAGFRDAKFAGEANFRDVQFSVADFRDTKFAGEADFRDAKYLGEADFCSAQLSGEACFRDAKFSREVNFRESQFSREADFSRAKFSGVADFRDAKFAGEANFRDVQFSVADFRDAKFAGVANFREPQFLREADFRDAQFSGRALFMGAQFSGKANFMGAQFSGVSYFVDAQFFGKAVFNRVKFIENANFKNITIEKYSSFEMLDTYFYNVSGLFEFIEENDKYFKKLRKRSWTLKTEFLPKNFKLILGEGVTARYPVQTRQIKDDMYLLDKKERIFRMHGIRKYIDRTLYFLWWFTADYGRKFKKWLFWCFVFIFIFGAVFADYGAPDFLSEDIKQILYSINPEFQISPSTRVPTQFTPYYFSIVTFTTLGFGDVTPLNLAGEIWLAIEVILGYIMLGGLISILANKLARRS